MQGSVTKYYRPHWNPNVRNSGEGAFMVASYDPEWRFKGFIPNTDSKSREQVEAWARRYQGGL